MDDSQLAQLFQTSGMAGGARAGYSKGIEQQSSLANAAFNRAQTDRTTQMTPHVVEQARLANLPGAAKEEAGTYQAQAREEAMKAQEALKTLPLETQQKLRSETVKRSNDLLQIAEQTLMTTGSTQATLEAMVQAYPEMANDKGWTDALAKYNKLSPQELQSEIKMKRHALASSNVYADPSAQKDFIGKGMQHSYDMERDAANNAARANEATIQASRPTGGGSSSMNPTEALLMLSEKLRTEQDPAMRKWLAYQIDLIGKSQVTAKEGVLGPQVTEKGVPTAPGMGPKKITIPGNALTYLKEHPDTAEAFESKFGVEKGWAQQYLANPSAYTKR